MHPERGTQVGTDTVSVDGWTVRFTSLPGDEQERYDPLLLVVKVDHQDRAQAVEHVRAHIRLGHPWTTKGRFSDEQEAAARAFAALKRDLEDDVWDDIPTDGEPSIHLTT